MTTFAVTMMRNEIDVVEGVLRHVADEVDHVIVADNLSDDGTRDVLDQLARELPLTVVDDPVIAYLQSQKMTALAARAAKMGAIWILPFDADEIWASHHGRIADALALAVGANVAPATVYNHYSTAVDSDNPDPFRRMQWRQATPMGLPKVAFRWHPGAVIHQGNHGVTLPGPVAPADGVLEVRHFPYRSAEQFVAKGVQGAAAYKATTLPPGTGAHWRMYGEIAERHGTEALAGVFREHFWYWSPIDSGLVHDPAPYRRWSKPAEIPSIAEPETIEPAEDAVPVTTLAAEAEPVD